MNELSAAGNVHDLLQGSGITAIVVYLGFKEFVNRMRSKNGDDDRIKWKDLFNGHEARLIAIETKLDLILTKLINGRNV